MDGSSQWIYATLNYVFRSLKAGTASLRNFHSEIVCKMYVRMYAFLQIHAVWFENAYIFLCRQTIATIRPNGSQGL